MAFASPIAKALAIESHNLRHICLGIYWLLASPRLPGITTQVGQSLQLELADAES
jgi:hypothetical protein